MLSEMSMRPMMGGGGDGFSSEEMGLLLREHQRQEASDWERELNIYRSGSAPPTVEGSLSAIGGFFGGSGNGGLLNASGAKQIDGFASEEELRSDPAYLEYYYSHVNLNPRLPPPLLSKEDWRFAQRLQAGNLAFGGIGDKRTKTNELDGDGSHSLFSTQLPVFGSKKEELKVQPWRAAGSSEWLENEGDGLTGLPGTELSRQKNYDTVLQDDGHASCHLSRPGSCIGFSDDARALSSGEAHFNVQNKIRRADGHLLSGVQSNGFQASHIFSPASVPNNDNKRLTNSSATVNGGSSSMTESDDLVAALSGISLSGVGDLTHDGLSGVRNFLSSNSPGSSHLSNANDMNAIFSSGGLGGFSIDPALSPMTITHNNASNSMFINASVAPGIAFSITDSGVKEGYSSGSNLKRANLKNHKGTSRPTGPFVPQMPVNPHLVQYLKDAEYATQAGIGSSGPSSLEMGYMADSYVNLLEIQKAYAETLRQSENNYGIPFINKSTNLDNSYYGNPAFGLGYTGSPLASHVPHASFNRLGSPHRNSIAEYGIHFPSSSRNFNASMMGPWFGDTNCMLDNTYTSSLLDEFKINKTKCFELSEIDGHVVEFSADQYGSRFIQQKLETASKEEKDMVFEEIMPQAHTLMTDVFGNYVVQKFFEHGSAAQIRDLANQVTGHVLALSLQMYGCRVIQKAIEVVELDQKTKMVAELDGHVMRCVRDQNGNHVIQKCIECIPEDAIQSIVSTFYGQIVTLSTHPYGCRVIQRLLEHCHGTKTQQIMMDEILQSVYMLAQDQYGNYVIQHVLEHGKHHERSAIMNKLTGQVVQLSQQKFASNVIEKCLTFGDPTQRQSLVNEMLGSTDLNEPLEVMMKDQFANYVVQKVLETCDDDQRGIILTRIKVHLSALKKYTYGKHIVARVEKLVAAGERRVGIQSACSSKA